MRGFKINGLPNVIRMDIQKRRNNVGCEKLLDAVHAKQIHTNRLIDTHRGLGTNNLSVGNRSNANKCSTEILGKLRVKRRRYEPPENAPPIINYADLYIPP